MNSLIVPGALILLSLLKKKQAAPVSADVVPANLPGSDLTTAQVVNPGLSYTTYGVGSGGGGGGSVSSPASSPAPTSTTGPAILTTAPAPTTTTSPAPAPTGPTVVPIGPRVTTVVRPMGSLKLK